MVDLVYLVKLYSLEQITKVAVFEQGGVNTPRPLYNTVRYNTVLTISRFKDGSQKCIDYIEK